MHYKVECSRKLLKGNWTRHGIEMSSQLNHSFIRDYGVSNHFVKEDLLPYMREVQGFTRFVIFKNSCLEFKRRLHLIISKQDKTTLSRNPHPQDKYQEVVLGFHGGLLEEFIEGLISTFRQCQWLASSGMWSCLDVPQSLALAKP